MKDDKLLPSVLTNPANIMPPSIVLTGGPENSPLALNQDSDKSKLLSIAQTSSVSGRVKSLLATTPM